MKIGTTLTQKDYLRLEKAAEDLTGHCDSSTVLTDAEAILLINGEFGFEASKIQLLHEAEIDVTEEGARAVKIEKVPRKALNVSTDWNYARFNACGWQYELVNGSIHFVYD